jgi:hypothetical protein
MADAKHSHPQLFKKHNNEEPPHLPQLVWYQVKSASVYNSIYKAHIMRLNISL